MRGATRNGAPRPAVRRAAWAGMALLYAALLAVAVLAASAVWHLVRLPVDRVIVSGEITQVSREVLRSKVAAALEGGFFTVDLWKVRASVEELPWVSQASVRRRWPGSLDIHVTEQVPVARWSSHGYLNREGELFVPSVGAGVVSVEEAVSVEGAVSVDGVAAADGPGTGIDGKPLPQLTGPPGSEALLMGHFRQVQGSLQGLQLDMAGLDMNPRGSLTVRLADGASLVLGRRDIGLKLRRFEHLYRARLAHRADRWHRADLRYSHGIAVAWDGGLADERKQARGDTTDG